MGLFGSSSEDAPPDSNVDLYKPDYASYGGEGTKLYRRFLRGQLKGGRRDAESRYRASAFDAIGGQQLAAGQQLQQALTSNFGGNNTSGVEAGLRSRIALAPNFAAANIGAIEAGNQAKSRAGQALEASRQNQANWYLSLLQPALQQETVNAQIGIANQQAGVQEQAAWLNLLGSLVGGGASAFAAA